MPRSLRFLAAASLAVLATPALADPSTTLAGDWGVVSGDGHDSFHRAMLRKALAAQESGRLAHLLPELRWPVKWAYYAVASSKALRRHEVRVFHEIAQTTSQPGGFIS